MSQQGQVAIIGAGLGGLALALTLHKFSIPCTIYELRSEKVQLSGAITISPNAWRIYTGLGLPFSIRSEGYEMEYVDYKNEKMETMDRYPFGSAEKYGVKALRIQRCILVQLMRDVAKERGIEIVYERRLERVVKEESGSVSFQFDDGVIKEASLLVGADGVHSKVREFVISGSAEEIDEKTTLSSLTSKVKSQYTGQTAFVGFVQRSKLCLPYPDFTFPAFCYGTGSNGAFLMIPQGNDGEEVAVATHRAIPEQTREGWGKLDEDKEGIVRELWGDETGEWPDLVKSAIENIDQARAYTWSYHQLPTLEYWVSKKGRCAIIGDAAHQIPPSGGQGANQAFEDGWTLAHALHSKPEAMTVKEMLDIWEGVRRKRVQKVTELTAELGRIRLPMEERVRLNGGKLWRAEECDVEWLFGGKPEKDVLDRLLHT